jgi:hypothetical protein
MNGAFRLNLNLPLFVFEKSNGNRSQIKTKIQFSREEADNMSVETVLPIEFDRDDAFLDCIGRGSST